MALSLFSAERHEALTRRRWDEQVAADAIEQNAVETLTAFSPEDLWPIHPIDRSPERASVLTPLYYGAAGVVWALHQLGYLTAEVSASIATIASSNRQAHADRLNGADSFFMGRSGIDVLRSVISGGSEERAITSLQAGADLPTNGVIWGRAGCAIGALHLYRATGDKAAERTLREIAQSLVDDWIQRDGAWLWRTELYGHNDHMLSALHGMAANLAPLVQGIDQLPVGLQRLAEDRIGPTLARSAVREGKFVNWPLTFGESSRPTASSRLLQHCNGAPGLINVFRCWPDTSIDETLTRAGELIWRAGPLRKRPSLCHGVPGSGLALLRLFERTGEARWLERARRFAMHAIAQDRQALAATGQRKFSLWTGDLGLAVFLRQCIDARAGFPTVDYF